MKKVLIAVALLLLVGGGAGGYLVYFGNADKQPAEPKPLPPPEYMKLDRFVVPIIRQGVVDGYSRLEVTLEVTDFETRKQLELRFMPRLRDAIQTDLHAYLPLRRAAGAGATADVEALRKRILAVVEKQVGPGKVTGVLLEEVMDVAPKSTKPGG
jgi:flagellar basal body-associated protein FliL